MIATIAIGLLSGVAIAALVVLILSLIALTSSGWSYPLFFRAFIWSAMVVGICLGSITLLTR
jgi:hypothetical protein